jgi:dienelactone hydrolase
MPIHTIQITTSDNVTIEGDWCGEGDIGLVMAHGLYYLNGKDSYRRELEYFGRNGVRALAISFRGYPSDEVPPMDEGRVHDIIATVDYLVNNGCTRVYVLGSSMGGWITLQAAHSLNSLPHFTGLVILSAGRKGLAAGLTCRKLFVAAEDDPDVLANLQEMFRVASKPKRMEIYRNGGHGQKLFQTRGDELRSLILEFITAE